METALPLNQTVGIIQPVGWRCEMVERAVRVFHETDYSMNLNEVYKIAKDAILYTSGFIQIP
jgi:hypothetical protein